MVKAPTVWVTGLAWTTALGADLDGVWRRLLGGETGLAALPHPHRLRNNLAAAVPHLPLDRPAGQRLRRLAAETARRAMADAVCRASEPGVRLVLGTSLGGWVDDEAEGTAPLHRWADDVARELEADAAPVAVSTACSSGSDAIALGCELIRSGAARVCVCGGCDVLTPAKRLAHSALQTLSPTTLRAFDRRHDGTLLGEGAAFLVLEAEPGRSPHAVLRGTGSGNDAAGLTAPDTTARGALLALRRSLADAGLGPEAIDLINAHGSGTPLNDATEREAFRAVFPAPARPLVFATKGNFGHSLGATGALEAVATVLALAGGEVPPVVNLEQPDPEFPLPLAVSRPLSCPARFGLSLTLGFGGFDTSLIFEVPS